MADQDDVKDDSKPEGEAAAADATAQGDGDGGTKDAEQDAGGE